MKTRLFAIVTEATTLKYGKFKYKLSCGHTIISTDGFGKIHRCPTCCGPKNERKKR